ncbi:MAG: ABC transporter permease [Fimbriiglobus sp.]
MTYALATIWYERQRFLPAIFAVAFSAVLIAVQCGIMIGLLSTISLPVDKSTADIWVGYPGVRSVDLGRPIPERWVSRLQQQPEVVYTEPAILGFSLWIKVSNRDAPATPEVITVVGTKLDPGSLGAVEYLREHPEIMARLREPNAVAVDGSDLGRLGIEGIGDQAEVFGHRIKVVGIVEGYRSIGGPYVFCSIETARKLVRDPPGGVTYHLAKCRNPEDAQVVAERLSEFKQMSAYTSDELSTRSRLYWLTTTKAGIAVGFTALLGLLVGAVVTSQTLYAATAASQREFATMRAMGIPRWRLELTVVEQSLWVGFFGILAAVPTTLLLAEAANLIGTTVRLHPLIVLASAAVTLLMALGSGLAALRSFQGVDPAHNIR